MRSPIAGRVSRIAQIGPGSVLDACLTTMEVVLDVRALIVDARIAPPTPTRFA